MQTGGSLLIFLPNKFERYTAAIRNSIQIAALKNGITETQTSTLKKIYIAEAILSPCYQPIDLKELTFNLLMGAYIKLLSKDIKISPLIRVNGTFIINKKLLICLLLSLCSISETIKISNYKQKIVILCNNDARNFDFLINAIKGICFYELKTNASMIIIPAKRTEKKPLKTEREWEYIKDPFSPINIFL